MTNSDRKVIRREWYRTWGAETQKFQFSNDHADKFPIQSKKRIQTNPKKLALDLCFLSSWCKHPRPWRSEQCLLWFLFYRQLSYRLWKGIY
ncbi:hypothetical protein V6N13_087182 [Hibiscus sabdariffa]